MGTFFVCDTSWALVKHSSQSVVDKSLSRDVRRNSYKLKKVRCAMFSKPGDALAFCGKVSCRTIAPHLVAHH